MSTYINLPRIDTNGNDINKMHNCIHLRYILYIQMVSNVDRFMLIKLLPKNFSLMPYVYRFSSSWNCYL